jgi:hypothetical protein
MHESLATSPTKGALFGKTKLAKAVRRAFEPHLHMVYHAGMAANWIIQTGLCACFPWNDGTSTWRGQESKTH